MLVGVEESAGCYARADFALCLAVHFCFNRKRRKEEIVLAPRRLQKMREYHCQ